MDYFTWECSSEKGFVYAVSSPEGPNKDLLWLSKENWEFVFQGTEMNDYQVQWGESAKAVKNAMKKKKAGKSKRQAGAGKSKVGDNKSPNSKKDIFVIIDGK